MSDRARTIPSSGFYSALLMVGLTATVFAGFEHASGDPQWSPAGPAASRFGQVENVSPNNEVSGAVHTVAAHPTNANILYIGGTNGGVWRTNNATSASPTWTPLTDSHTSLSIGALEFDPTDATGNTLVVGNGKFSSFGRRGGSRAGLLRTTDGGSTWSPLSSSMQTRNISGIAARGNTIVASVNIADSFTFSNIGIFRSTDGGTTFSQISTGNGASTGLPGGVSYDLASDPTNSAVLYTSTVFSDIVGGQNGFYKSTDTGATWTKVSSPAMDALISNSTSNIEFAVGNSGEVYAAILNSGRVDALYRSSNGNSGTWVQMDTPSTNENGTDVGLNPSGGKGPMPGDPDFTPAGVAGGQGSIHFSIRADPNNSNIVYVGGDRQPRTFGDTGSFPNSIGAVNFSGRLFRGDASQPAGSQFAHLTHNRFLGAAGGGTLNNSSPHADSREMVFDANGDIIEVDDGGVYRRTNPTSDTGDWFSINGNLQVTEIHDVAYDSNANIIISGNQDTGTTQQSSAGATLWDSVSTADGGDVSVDTKTLAGSNRSIRYSSFQNLGAFRKRTYDSANNLISQSFPSLTPLGGAPNISGQFVTPVELNEVDPTRILFGGSNGIYESLDQGNTISRLSTASVNASSASGKTMAYGGYLNGVPNENVIYAADGSDILIQTTAGGGFFNSPFPGGTVHSLVLNDDDWQNAFATDSDQVFTTINTGAFWSDITGDLISEGADDLRAIEFVDLPGSVSFDVVLVGSASGVFYAKTNNLLDWTELGGATLPNVLVWDMQYDATDDLLVAGTLGRGAFTIEDFSTNFLCTPGDTDNDGDIDTVDLTTAITNFTGAGGTGKTCADGDTDDDGDVDTVDLTYSITNFTGAIAATPNVPDLVYDPATGNVTIDADGADMISFSLQTGPFNPADFSDLPAGLTDNILNQIGWTSFNLFSGLTGTADLGAILPAGLDEAGLLAALQTASYGLALATGGGGGRFDIIIPEPGTIVLAAFGALMLARRRVPMM